MLNPRGGKPVDERANIPAQDFGMREAQRIALTLALSLRERGQQ
jgi:hypothetical protein